MISVGFFATLRLAVKQPKPAPPRKALAEYVADRVVMDNAHRVASKRPMKGDGEGRSLVRRNEPKTIAEKRARVNRGQLDHVAPLYDKLHRWAKASGYRVSITQTATGYRVEIRVIDEEIARALAARGYRWLGVPGPLLRKIKKWYEREKLKQAKSMLKSKA